MLELTLALRHQFGLGAPQKPGFLSHIGPGGGQGQGQASAACVLLNGPGWLCSLQAEEGEGWEETVFSSVAFCCGQMHMTQS